MFGWLLGKIGLGIDRLADFLSERNNHACFRTKKGRQAIKD